MTKVSELSIFFPFWNEEKNVESVVEKAIPVAEKVAEKWEIIMVDDGSSDNTLEIAKKLAAKDKRLVVATPYTKQTADTERLSKPDWLSQNMVLLFLTMATDNSIFPK